VPVQLDITDEISIKNAHTFIAETLKARNISGLDVLINKSAVCKLESDGTLIFPLD
jgi:NAD(P)-dependent dehydrogenase (short-subunit alcohol dehydrogenase family)